MPSRNSLAMAAGWCRKMHGPCAIVWSMRPWAANSKQFDLQRLRRMVRDFLPALPMKRRCGLFLVLSLGMLSLRAEAQTSAGLVDVRMSGDVRCIQPMGDGSFVLGGYTLYYNDQRETGMLRLTAAGARVTWPVTVGGNVFATVLDGGWLYLGGDFQTVNGVSVPFVARVNAATGAVDGAWRPAPNGDILDMVPAGGGLVVSGSFSRVGGLSRSRVAMLKTTGTGRAQETWRCDADAQVDALAAAGGKVFLGGRFKKLNTTNISYLARVDAATGAVEPAFNPSPQFHVFDLAADASHLYCGGSFSRLGSGGPAFLARASLTTGTVDTSWAPNLDGLVTRVTVSGDSVYAAGSWLNAGGVPHRGILRAAKSASGSDPAWRPAINGGVLALAPDGSNGVWAGGRFDSGGTGAGFARFTSTQGTAAPAYPGRVENAGSVRSVISDGAGGMFVGGDFDTVNGARKPALFRMTGSYTVDAAWSAGLGGFYPVVNAMDLIPDALGGAEVQIAGQFEVQPASLILYNCLRLKTATGAVQQGFAPQPDNLVNAMVRHGDVWVLGGGFTKLGNITAPNLARFDVGGLVDAGWKPEPNNTVYSLLSEAGELYVGGTFQTFGKAPTIYPVPYLARIAVMLPDLAWQPRPNEAVFAMASNGTHLFAGGRFTSMARSKRQYLAQIPLGGAGTATAWNPRPGNSVNALHLDASHLYVGGAFFSIANFQWPKLARFSRSSLALDTSYQTTGEDGIVTCLAPRPDGSLLAGGSFSGWDNSFSKRSLVRISAGVGAAPPPQALAQPPEMDETLELYFAAGSYGIAPLAEGTGLTWQENPALPPGMVARVQWSHDLADWHESGDSADGVTRSVLIYADESERRAVVLTDGSPPDPPPPLFLRLAVTPGESPAQRLP